MRGLKTALKIAETYQKNVEKGVEKSNAELDNLLDLLSRYQNKNGTISKSKTRSKKAQKAVKNTLKELQRFKSKKARTQSRQIAETAEKLASQQHLGMTGAGAAAAAEVFIKWTNPILPKHFMSELILALADSQFSGDDIINILTFLGSTLNSQVPAEMDKFTSEDDVSLFISNLSNIHEAYPDISTEDAIQIADSMNYYGFDDIESAVENWYTEDNDEYDY